LPALALALGALVAAAGAAAAYLIRRAAAEGDDYAKAMGVFGAVVLLAVAAMAGVALTAVSTAAG